MINPISPIAISPSLPALSYTKPVTKDISPSMTTPDDSTTAFILSKLKEMQITVFELQRDHLEQLKLKDEEIEVYRSALSSLGVPLPNRKCLS